MRIESTPLQADIRMITEDHSTITSYQYTVSVLGGGSQVTAMKMESLVVHRDYVRQYGTETVLTAWFVEADVNNVILPNVKDLEVVITRRSATGSTETKVSAKAVTERFKGVLTDVTIPQIGEANVFARDPNKAMKRLTIQCLDRALYRLRTVNIGGTYRSTTAAAVLRTALTTNAATIALDNSTKPLGVDFYPADTELKEDGTPNLRNHVIVKHGVLLPDLAGYLQHYCGGIYNNGCGCFYQDRYWYVYPLFDNYRYYQSNRTLNVIRVPADGLPDLQNSYTYRGNHLYVLGTADAISIDTVNHKEINQGNGSIFPTASGLFDAYSARDGSANADQSKTMGRIAVTTRKDGVDNATFVDVTDNVAREVSSLAAQQQQFIQLGWPYSDHTLIYPGMPVRVYYDAQGKTAFLQGVVAVSETMVELASSGMASTNYNEKTVITVYVSTPPAKRA